MERKCQVSWWLVGILGAIVVILLACIVAAFAGGLTAWLVVRKEWRTLQYNYAPPRPYVMPTAPSRPEVPFGIVGGAVVDSVTPNSPAEEAGLQRGDVILTIDGQEIGLTNDLRETLSRYQPGDTVSLEVRRWRTGQTETVRVRLGSHPNDPNRPYLGIEYRTVPSIGSPGD